MLNLEKYDDILTAEEVFEILRVGKNVGYELLNKGKIQCFKIGREYKIPKHCLVEYIRAESDT